MKIRRGINSSNPRMKETDDTNDKLSKQIQDEENKENNDVNNGKLLARSPQNLQESDTESHNHSNGNENVNDWSKCNGQLLKRSAAIHADWRRLG